jgi:hypothetical protein
MIAVIAFLGFIYFLNDTRFLVLCLHVFSVSPFARACSLIGRWTVELARKQTKNLI